MESFNAVIRESMPDGFAQAGDAISVWDSSLKQAAETVLGERDQQIKKPWITNETFTLIKEKHTLEHQNRKDEFKVKCKEVRKAIRSDWHQWLSEITDAELDIRDKWLGIKYLKRTKQANLFERSNLQGQSVDFKNQADAAADYLEQKQWGNHPSDEPVQTKTKTQNKKSNVYNMSPIDVEEVRAIIKRFKKGKSVGPDEIPMEFYKWLDEDNLKNLCFIFNTWWISGELPDQKAEAFVASIYKKGDPKNPENYRPIAILNSVYKIYAGVIQARLANALDGDLQNTQYGFRKARSTSIPLAIIRRVLENAEAGQHPCHMVFLDWEKAFDRIKHDKLLEWVYQMCF